MSFNELEQSYPGVGNNNNNNHINQDFQAISLSIQSSQLSNEDYIPKWAPHILESTPHILESTITVSNDSNDSTTPKINTLQQVVNNTTRATNITKENETQIRSKSSCFPKTKETREVKFQFGLTLNAFLLIKQVQNSSCKHFFLLTRFFC